MSKLNYALDHLKRFIHQKDSEFPTWIYERYRNELTYRLNPEANADCWLGFKELYRVFRRRKLILKHRPYSYFLLVSSQDQKITPKEYCEIHLNAPNDILVICREELRISLTPKYLFITLQIAIRCIFSKNRIHLGLQIREIIEWGSVCEILEKLKIKNYIDFTPFERDSNILAALLIKEKKNVLKIPSPGPLRTHHKYMLSNAVIFSSAYHLEEYKTFSKWNINSILCWPPDLYHTYKHRYENNQNTIKKNIAFYSHGEWVRREEGHADPGLGILENEAIILSELRTFLQENNHITLVIYPHPKERKRKDMLAHYMQLLSDCSFHIFDGETPTAWNFHEEDIAIMAYSTLLFERLALGFKTLFVSAQPGPFPLSTSPLNNICIRSEAEFQKKLKITLQESQIEFFENNLLQTYRLSHFLKAKNGQD